MTVEGAIQRVEYSIEEDGTDILLYVRTEEDERKEIRIEKPFRPYFFTTRRTVSHGSIERLQRTDQVPLYSDSDRLLKIETSTPKEVGQLKRRDEFNPTFEADIIYPHRFLVNSGLKYGIEYDESTGDYSQTESDIEPKRMYLDIEISGEDAIDNIKKAPGKIVIIGTYIQPDDELKFFVMKHPDMREGDELEEFKSESALLESFIDYVNEKDPDQIIGKNLEGFDMPYLKYRCKRLKIDFDDISPMNSTKKRRNGGFVVYGRDTLDWENFYKQMKDTELESNRMHDILEDELGWDPVRVDDFEECWKNDPDRLLKRNEHDIVGPARIDEKMLIPKFFNELRKLVGCRYPKTQNFGGMADLYLLREMFNTKYVAPSRATYTAKDDQPLPGAVVLDPKKGRWEDVVVVDLSSAYPSMMRTFNLSPETFIPDEGADPDFETIEVRSNTEFRVDKKGLIPLIEERLMKRRDKKKEKMRNSEGEEKDNYYSQQFALKILCNSFYGLLAQSSSRWFQYRMADGITRLIREVIRYVRDYFERRGYNAVYGDTDSIFIQRKGDPEEMVEMANEAIGEYMEEEHGIQEHEIKMDLDKRFESMIIREKKLYVGRKPSGDLEIKGIGAKRSDVSPVAKELQLGMLDMMLDGKEKSAIGDKIREKVNEIREGKVDLENIGVPTRYSKDPSEYDPTRMRTKIAKRSDRLLDIEIESGDKPRRVFCKGIGRIAVFDENDLGDLLIDYGEMISSYIKPKLEPFFELYGLDWERDIEGQRRLF